MTAQKKAESLQRTPISLTAFSQERLEIEGISQIGDLAAKVPSLTIEPFPINNATLRVFIRGIGISDAQITQDPAVGVYLDGIYIARSTGTALDVADLERIEVLRGPQGTLYGRNTTGGAINLITRRPSSEEIEFKQKLSMGQRELLSAKTTLNLPLTDKLAIKLAAMHTESDGFISNSGPGGNFGGREVSGYRLDLGWQLTDTLDLDYAYDNSALDYYNTPFQHIRPRRPVAGSQADLINAQAATRYTSSRQRSAGTVARFESSTTDIEGHALIVSKDFDHAQLKYLGAYRQLYDRSYADLGGGLPLAPGQNPHGIGADSKMVFRLDANRYCGQAAEFIMGSGGCTPRVDPVITQEQWSHELQLSGELFGERAAYLLGAYYFKEEAEEDNTPLHHQLSGPVNLGLPSVEESLGQLPIAGGILADIINPLTTLRAVNFLSQHYQIENEALAAFGQLSWTPPLWEDRLRFTVGVRHSRDQRATVKFQRDLTVIETPVGPIDGSAAQCSDGTGSCRNFDNIAASRDFSNTAFSFISQYELSDSRHLYFKIMQAYKSGGFNTRDPQRDGQQGPATDGNDYGFGYAEGFDPEFVTAYELGMKTELLQRRLRLNANIFFSQYEDMQLNFILQGSVADTKVSNAGEAEMLGFETDMTFLAHRRLLLMLNYAYLDAKVTQATDINGADVSDDFVFFSAPERSFTLAAQATLLSRPWGELALNLSMSYMGERNGGTRAENVANTRLDPYQLFNARLSLGDMALAGGRFSVALWASNLLDEEYALTAVDNLPQADRSVIWGEPSRIGLDLYFEY